MRLACMQTWQSLSSLGEELLFRHDTDQRNSALCERNIEAAFVCAGRWFGMFGDQKMDKKQSRVALTLQVQCTSSPLWLRGALYKCWDRVARSGALVVPRNCPRLKADYRYQRWQEEAVSHRRSWGVIARLTKRQRGFSRSCADAFDFIEGRYGGSATSIIADLSCGTCV